MSVGRVPVQVTVTGAAGQIGYALVFRVASGQMFGLDQPIVLRMLEIEPAMKSLEGVAMELDDCAFPMLAGMELTSKAEKAFEGASWAILVGSVPRKAGMERSDLLSVNGGIFGPQGKAIETVQKRGAAVIEARGASSAASAANAAIDSVVSVRTPTPWGDWHSLAVVSHGEYGVPDGLQFGFPVRSDGERWEVVPDLQHDDDAWDRIKKTTQELLQEQEMVKGLVPAEAS